MRRRIFIISFVLLGIIITATSVLVFKVDVGRADNTTFASGKWQGRGSFINGQSGFPMTLTLSVNGTTFTGDLAEGTLNSEATVGGSVSSTVGNSVGITFMPTQIISGSQIELGTIYSATFSGGRINGAWSLSGHTTADGNFTLDLAPPVTPTPIPTQPQPPAPAQPPTQPQPPAPAPAQPPTQPQPPTPAQPPTQPQPPTPTQPQPPTNPPQYVPSGNGQTANVLAAITWYGFDNNPSTANLQGSVAILYPQSANNPTLHNGATEGTGTFNDPITFATRANDQQTFPIGSVIYVPLTQKYYIMEDACDAAKQQSCTNGGGHQVELWMGPSQAGGTALMNCEQKNTPVSSLNVIINPSPSLQVDTTPEFSNGQCSLHTF